MVSFKGAHFGQDVILTCVRWYRVYPLSCLQVKELMEERNEQAEKRFLTRAIRRHGLPENIIIDGSTANEAAIKRDNEAYGTAIEIRQIRYLNNIVE